MAGAPGLDAPLWDGEAVGQVIQLLHDILHVHATLHMLAHNLSEVLVDALVDDKNDPLEADLQGIVQGIVNQAFSVEAKGGHLLEAAEPAADSRGHDDQNGFLHVASLQFIASVSITHCPTFGKAGRNCGKGADEVQ